MAGFLTNTGLGALARTSTIGAFAGGVARGIDEQILGKQEQDAKLEQLRLAKANQSIKEWKAEQKQLMKDGSAQDYLTGIGLKGDDLRRAMSAYRGGIPLTDIANGIQRNSQNNDSSIVNSVTGNPSIGAGGSTDLDGVTDPLMAAAIVKQHESNGNYFIGYDGGKGIDLKNAPTKPGYYGFPDYPGANNSHAAGAHGFEPDTWKTYAAQVSKTLGRDVDWHNPSDQDAVFDAAWKAEGKALWAPYWNKNLPRPQVAQAQSTIGTPPASPVPSNQQQIPDTGEAQSFAEGGEADNPNMGAYIMSGGGQQAQQNQQPLMQNIPASVPQQNQSIQNPTQEPPNNPQINHSIQNPVSPLAAGQAPSMSDAGNDIRNPAIQDSMPGGTQTADASFMYPSRSAGNGNNQQLMDQLHREQINNLNSEIQNRKQEQMNKLYEQELNERKLNLQMLQSQKKDVYPPSEKDDEFYLNDKVNGLNPRYAGLLEAQKQLGNVQLMEDALNRGFRADRPQDAIDNLNRFTKPVFGIDLTNMFNANTIQDTNTVKKAVSATILNQLKTYHFGRILEKEVDLTTNSIMNSGSDPNTNVKVLLLTRAGVRGQMEGVQEEYNALHPNGKTSDRDSIAAARNIYMQTHNKELTDTLPWQKATDKTLPNIVKNSPIGSWIEDQNTGRMYQVIKNDGQNYQLRPADYNQAKQ